MIREGVDPFVEERVELRDDAFFPFVADES